jgi:hypothetical protein
MRNYLKTLDSRFHGNDENGLSATFYESIIFVTGIFLGGCAAKINYSYDPAADFSKVKSYSWDSGMYAYRQNPLIDKNVRYHTDQSLQEKGFTLNPDKPDLVISMNYETDYSDPYKVRFLSLSVYRTQGKGMIWQGTAGGPLNAAAASTDLAEAVKKMLTNFPPK